ncbi:hypothetical protein [Legionella pneumophila]|nr:hypothetical protein [Legionella pneumophila]
MLALWIDFRLRGKDRALNIPITYPVNSYKQSAFGVDTGLHSRRYEFH